MAKPINATTTYVNDTIDASLAPINERVAVIEAKTIATGARAAANAAAPTDYRFNANTR